MKEATKQIGIRIPASQYLSLKERAKANDLTLTELIISIFDNYLDMSIPGLCPNCHHQNLPDAKFCSECGTPLTEEAKFQINGALKTIINNWDMIKVMMRPPPWEEDSEPPNSDPLQYHKNRENRSAKNNDKGDNNQRD